MGHAKKPKSGELLEGAIILAAEDYRDKGRADVFHRPTPKIWSHKRKRMVYTATAGVDFNGSVNGVAICFDAKETHQKSWPIGDITDEQIETLRRNRSGLSGIVIGFLPNWHVYWISIVEFDQFLAAKWRESLSEDWCKAFGSVLPVDCRPSLRQKGRFVRHVRFLDGEPAKDRDAAKVAVNFEQAKATVRNKRGPARAGEDGPTGIIQSPSLFTDGAGTANQPRRCGSTPPLLTTPAVHPLEDPADDFLDWSKPNPPRARPSAKGTALDLVPMAKWARKRGLGKKGWSE